MLFGIPAFSGREVCILKTEIKTLLEGVRNGSVSVDEALLKLKTEPYEDGFMGRFRLQEEDVPVNIFIDNTAEFKDLAECDAEVDIFGVFQGITGGLDIALDWNGSVNLETYTKEYDINAMIKYLILHKQS